MAVVFETERLIARELVPEDADGMFAVFREPEVWTYLGVNSPYVSVDDALGGISREQVRYEQHAPMGNWAVVVRDTGQLIGTVLVQTLENGPDIEVGYALGKFAWGFGYATEICKAAIDHGFATLPVEQLVGVVFPENIPSQRVLEKAGMIYQRMRHTFGSELMYYTISRPTTAK